MLSTGACNYIFAKTHKKYSWISASFSWLFLTQSVQLVIYLKKNLKECHGLDVDMSTSCQAWS